MLLVVNMAALAFAPPGLPHTLPWRMPLMCAAPREFDVPTGIGSSERVSIAAFEDIPSVAAELAQRHSLGKEDAEGLEGYLYGEWLDAEEDEEAEKNRYIGPSTSAPLTGLRCSIELPEVGLVLEVADSLVGDGDAGSGLFVRTMEGVRDVRLQTGTAVCGYAAGSYVREADDDGGKTVGFALREPNTSVFFEQQLWTVAELLAPGSSVKHIAGHSVVRGADGTVESIEQVSFCVHPIFPTSLPAL